MNQDQDRGTSDKGTSNRGLPDDPPPKNLSNNKPTNFPQPQASLKTEVSGTGYPQVTRALIEAFDLKKTELSKADKVDYSKLDCVTTIHQATDDAYRTVYKAFQNLQRALGGPPSPPSRDYLNLVGGIKDYFAFTDKNRSEVIQKLIDVSNRILTGELGLKSKQVTYDKQLDPRGFAKTWPYSSTTNLSSEAIEDLINNKSGYIIHSLIHETIHRVTDFGKKLNAFDIYTSNEKFEKLTLEEALKNPDSYTKCFIQIA